MWYKASGCLQIMKETVGLLVASDDEQRPRLPGQRTAPHAKQSVNGRLVVAPHFGRP